MFAEIMGGLAIGTFVSAGAFAAMGDPRTGAWMLAGCAVCCVIAMVKR